MCWQYDIESTMTTVAPANTPSVAAVPATVAAPGESIRLTDVELLVGNLYAARQATDTEPQDNPHGPDA